MPARSKSKRRAKRLKRKKKESRRFGLSRRLGFLALIFAAVYLFVSLSTKFWKQDKKLAIVVVGDSSVTVGVFDPVSEKITSFAIPADLQVNAARQYGVWRIGALRNLGKDEGVGTKLVSESILFHLNLPVFIWAEQEAEGFLGDSIWGVLKASLYPYDTNLGVGDKLKLGFFALSTKRFKKEEIDFSRLANFKRQTLKDGEEGFVLTKDLPASITSHFSDNYFSSQRIAIQIVNKSGRLEASEVLAGVVEVLGAKAAAIVNEEAEDFDCLVTTDDKMVSETLADIFSCKGVEGATGSFDARLEVGTEFADRL